jgi:beta-1,4-N-acetylglucosaminyltransferase
MKIILVCSTGGHFSTCQQLRPFWQNHDHVWVTFRTPTTEDTLKNEKVYWAWGPTNRNIPNLVRNFFLSWRVLQREKPDVVISTGAGVSVPFLCLARLQGSQTIFVESITRVTDISLSAKLVMPFLHIIYVHWEQLQNRYLKAELIMPLGSSSRPYS